MAIMQGRFQGNLGDVQELDHTSTALAAMEASHTTLAATSDQYSVQKGAFSRCVTSQPNSAAHSAVCLHAWRNHHHC